MHTEPTHNKSAYPSRLGETSLCSGAFYKWTAAERYIIQAILICSRNNCSTITPLRLLSGLPSRRQRPSGPFHSSTAVFGIVLLLLLLQSPYPNRNHTNLGPEPFIMTTMYNNYVDIVTQLWISLTRNYEHDHQHFILRSLGAMMLVDDVVLPILFSSDRRAKLRPTTCKPKASFSLELTVAN